MAADTKKTRNRKPAVRRDELVESVIKRLPAAGSPFPLLDRVAWLRMAVMAFDVSYGAAGDTINVSLPGGVAVPAGTSMAPGGMTRVDQSGAAMTDDPTNVTPLRRPTQAEVDALDEPRYYIRSDGMAFGPGNVRVKPADIPSSAVIEDERPKDQQADLSTIVWADGSWPPAALPSLNIIAA